MRIYFHDVFPLQIIQIVFASMQKHINSGAMGVAVFVSNFVIVCSYPTNFFIYCIMSKQFRKEFKRTFLPCGGEMEREMLLMYNKAPSTLARKWIVCPSNRVCKIIGTDILLQYEAYSIAYIQSNAFLGSCVRPPFLRIAFSLCSAHHGGNK